MWTISEMKQIGKRAFQGNYWYCVLAAALMTVFSGGAAASSRTGTSSQQSGSLQSAISSLEPRAQLAIAAGLLGGISLGLIIGLLLRIFLANPITVGGSAFFAQNVKRTPAPFDLIRVGFQNYMHTFVTLFLRDLYLFLWALLFVFPAAVKSYSYCMVPYILAENPDMTPQEVITHSREMMRGNKLRAFLMDLSFIGWILMGVMTAGIGFILWTAPYMYSTHAALYQTLKRETYMY